MLTTYLYRFLWICGKILLIIFSFTAICLIDYLFCHKSLSVSLSLSLLCRSVSSTLLPFSFLCRFTTQLQIHPHSKSPPPQKFQKLRSFQCKFHKIRKTSKYWSVSSPSDISIKRFRKIKKISKLLNSNKART